MSEWPTRRKLLAGSAGLATASVGFLGAKSWWRVARQPEARVWSHRLATYDEAALVDLLTRGIADYPDVIAKARGGTVLLKPNLVEVHPGRPINTDVRVLAAAVEAFKKHGAKDVIVGEGPGHHRDTELILERSGLTELLPQVGSTFVDLNLDRTVAVGLPSNFNGMRTLQLAEHAVRADLLVSVAKLKTHHWTGSTLTLKNLFGTVPGAVYGWPKNPLHHAGIERSIVDLYEALRPDFGIIDGVVGMEGDGPIMGTAVPSEVLFLGSNLPALDATASRFMGLEPDHIPTLATLGRLGYTIHPSRVRVEGEQADPMRFAVLPHMERFRGGEAPS